MTNIKASKKLSPIAKAWDLNSTPIPEDGYNLEEELKWLLGENVMMEKDFNNSVKKILNDLYKEIKHGDKEHKKWLKDKIQEFIKTRK